MADDDRPDPRIKISTGLCESYCIEEEAVGESRLLREDPRQEANMSECGEAAIEATDLIKLNGRGAFADKVQHQRPLPTATRVNSEHYYPFETKGRSMAGHSTIQLNYCTIVKDEMTTEGSSAGSFTISYSRCLVEATGLTLIPQLSNTR